MIRMRQINDHAGNDQWTFHEWYLNGKDVKADRNGRRNPNMYNANWLVVVCNNPHCGALAIINKDDLLGLLPPAPESKPVGIVP